MLSHHQPLRPGLHVEVRCKTELLVAQTQIRLNEAWSAKGSIPVPLRCRQEFWQRDGQYLEVS